MKKKERYFYVFCVVFLTGFFVFLNFSFCLAQTDFFKETISTIEKENTILRQNIGALQKEIIVLDQQNKKLEKDFERMRLAVDAQKSQTNTLLQNRLAAEKSSEEKQARLRAEGIQIAKEIMDLEKEAREQKNQETLLKDQVSVARKELEALKKQMASLENSNWEIEKKTLKDNLIVSEKKIRVLEKELARLENKYRKPLGILEGLKRDHFLLEQQVIVSKSALDNSLAEKQQQQVLLGQLDRKNQLQVLKLTEDITRLSVEKKKIESVIFQAKQKIQTTQAEILSAEEWRKEISRLEKILQSLNDEKLQLEKEKAMLEKSSR